jgi:hypothetical protein
MLKGLIPPEDRKLLKALMTTSAIDCREPVQGQRRVTQKAALEQ